MNGTNPEYIYKRVQADNIRNFRIYDSDKKTLLEDCTNNELTVDGCLQRIKDSLESYSGLVFVELCPRSRSERREAGADLTLKNAMLPVHCGGVIQSPVKGIGNTHQNSADIEEKWQARLDALEQKFMHKQEIDALKRELAEAKEANPYMKMLEPHIPQIIGAILPQGAMPAPRIAGPQDHPEETISFTEADEQNAEINLRRLLSVDPEFLDVLRRLADMAETNKPMYDMAKNMLPK